MIFDDFLDESRRLEDFNHHRFTDLITPLNLVRIDIMIEIRLSIKLPSLTVNE